MNIEGDCFAEFFALAQTDALTDRESRIVELRYGFMGGDPHTLEEIAQEFGISRERIRQILKKSHRKILSKGQRQLKSGRGDEPCAELLAYVGDTICPKDDNAIERLVDFVENALPYLPTGTHALPLVSYLAFQSQRVAKSRVAEARKLVREREYARRKSYRQQKQSEEFQVLFSDVIWPRTIRLPTEEEVAAFRRERRISQSSEGNTGVFHSDKLNRGVEYESELEHDFLLRLEQLDEVMFYQEQPFKIPYVLDGRKCLYFPDVLFILKDGRGVVVEVKPVFKMALRENLKKWAALKEFCSSRGLGLLITDGRYSIQQIQRHEINPAFVNAVLTSLRNGPLSWTRYKEIRDEYAVSRDDFVALILKHRLVWGLSPFALSSAS